MSDYDFYVTVTQPAAYDRGFTVGLIETYLSEPYCYEGSAESYYELGLTEGHAERDGWTAEDLLVLAHEFETGGIGLGGASAMSSLKYGIA